MDRINYGNGFDEALIAMIRHAALLPLWLYTHTRWRVMAFKCRRVVDATRIAMNICG